MPRTPAILLSVVMSTTALASSPPFADYCKMLERDIQDQHYGFIAGNTMYYVAGAFGAYWHENWESETIGFTHPMFRDGRARGRGIVDVQPGGKGHDYWGWEFWRRTRCAYGSVLLDGETYRHPKPETMLWRPDRHICTYKVGTATVTEHKFISETDVLCTIIQADRDLAIRFEGQGLFFKGRIPTGKHDPERLRISRKVESEAKHRPTDNVLHLLERGTVLVKALRDKPVTEGRLRYDGMSFLLSATAPLTDVTVEKDPDGPVRYGFTLRLRAGSPVALVHAAGDAYDEALGRAKQVLAAPEKALAAKTAAMNALLNEQIPYFRCSDPLVVETYYYLWALYFMYFMDVGQGWEQYPHTQTAVNNFMGLHLWDSWAYIQAGSWVADKWKWGHGNALQWQHMVEFKNKANMMPDNFGIDWYSPGTHMVFSGAVEPAWEQYRRSGDRRYLAEVYGKLFKPLYWDGNGPTPSFGIDVNAVDALARMARELGEAADIEHWIAMRPKKARSFKAKWSGRWQGFYGERDVPWKDIWALESLQSAAMPNEWAREMVDKFVMDTEQGFLSPVGVNTRAADSVPNGIFRCSTISSWLAIDGMFRQGCDYEGALVTLNHLKAMTREWGYPVAPEAWEENHKAWGSRYYNWDIAIVLPVLEWLAGIDYSIPDQVFRCAPHLPATWDFIETHTPVVVDGTTHWVKARVERTTRGDHVEQAINVEGNPLASLVIEPWAEGREVLRSTGTGTLRDGQGPPVLHTRGRAASATIRLGRELAPHKTFAWMTPRSRIFHGQTKVSAENLVPGTVLRYTTDGTEPNKTSPLFDGAVAIRKTTTFALKAFWPDTELAPAYTPYVATYTATDLEPAVIAETTRPGLRYELYELAERPMRLPDLAGLDPTRSGDVSPDWLDGGVDVTRIAGDRLDAFALRLSGFIRVENDAVYRFHILGDDGARLVIDGKTVVNLDTHCVVDPWEDEGSIGLAAGLHRVDLYYYQDNNRRKLLLKWRTGDQPIRGRVPAGVWSY